MAQIADLLDILAKPERVTAIIAAELAALREESGCFVLTNHPFVTGRPSRAAVLDDLIGQALGYGDVWVASLEEVAEHVRGLGLPPRSLSRPRVDPEYRPSP